MKQSFVRTVFGSHLVLCEFQDTIWRKNIRVYIFEYQNSLDSATRNILEYTETLVTSVANINLLTPSGFFTYDSKILHGARFAVSILYGYQNRQRFFLYTSLTDWFFITVVESVYCAVGWVFK